MRAAGPARWLRCLGLCCAFLTVLACIPAYGGHDQDEEDLTYFLPIAPERVKQLIDVGEPIFLFDLREVEEFKRERLPGAVSLPLKELPSQTAKVPRTGRVVLYCTCGPGNIEEAYGYQLLRDQGYRNVSVLTGGMTEWMKRGYPVDKEPRS